MFREREAFWASLVAGSTVDEKGESFGTLPSLEGTSVGLVRRSESPLGLSSLVAGST